MVLDDEYGEFEMNNGYVSSVDFVENLIDVGILWKALRVFRKNCESYKDYESELFNLSIQGKMDLDESTWRRIGHFCECVGDYTPIPTAEFASILAPLQAVEFESYEAYDALVKPLEDWIERLSRLPAAWEV